MNEEESTIFVLVAFFSRPNKAEENNSQCQGFHQETPEKLLVQSLFAKVGLLYSQPITKTPCDRMQAALAVIVAFECKGGVFGILCETKNTHMCLCLSLAPARYLQGTGPGSGFSHRAGTTPRCWFEPVTLMNWKRLKENVWEQRVLQQHWLVSWNLFTIKWN